MSVPDTVRHAAKQVITEQYVCLGYNYRMTDIQAAIGIEQMKRLDWIVERRRELAARYTRGPGRSSLAAAALRAGLRGAQFPELCGAVDRRCADRPGRTDAAAAGRGISTRRGIMLAHASRPTRATPPAAT